MKKIWLVVLASLALGFALAGCTGTRGVDRGGGYPECEPEYMVPPQLIYPQEGITISSLTPLFEWAYPGYYVVEGGQGEIMCSTPGFHLYLSSGPTFQDELGTTVSGVPAFDSLYTRTWTPSTPLTPGQEYRWYIRPISHGEEGPSSEVRTFFTGPACEPGTLSKPILLSPLNYWSFDDLSDLELVWWYPGACLPDFYDVEMSTTLIFNGSPFNASTDSPAMHWSPVQPLQDCTRYYWRIRGVAGDQEGQWSQVYNLYVNLTGACPTETYGAIRGTVWEDQCVPPGPGTPMPDPPPLGCVYPAPGEVQTNQSYDPGEPGIPWLVVSLGQGACPSSGYRDVSTWQDGIYDFYFISPGTYCVSVDSAEPMNTSTLQPGGWTFPDESVGNPLASQTVTVGQGQLLNNVNFGWWYQFGTAWGSTSASVFGMVWHDMCAYVPGDPIPDPLPEGCVLDQWGNVHADALRQVDEPGIPGVIVDIGPGDCPSAGLATSLTDENGYYSFTDLPAGKYCLRIDPDHGSPNEAVLIPGSWTVIPSGHEGMTFRAITLTANHTLPGQDFGWDFDNLPIAFTLENNAYCRIGPDIKYEAQDFGLAGQTFMITGRSENGLWFYVDWLRSTHCWLSASMGTASGDWSGLRVYYGPPLPEPSVSCSAHGDQTSCLADPLCTWAFSAAGPGFCRSK